MAAPWSIMQLPLRRSDVSRQSDARSVRLSSCAEATANLRSVEREGFCVPGTRRSCSSSNLRRACGSRTAWHSAANPWPFSAHPANVSALTCTFLGSEAASADAPDWLRASAVPGALQRPWAFSSASYNVTCSPTAAWPSRRLYSRRCASGVACHSTTMPAARATAAAARAAARGTIAAASNDGAGPRGPETSAPVSRGEHPPSRSTGVRQVGHGMARASSSLQHVPQRSE